MTQQLVVLGNEDGSAFDDHMPMRASPVTVYHATGHFIVHRVLVHDGNRVVEGEDFVVTHKQTGALFDGLNPRRYSRETAVLIADTAEALLQEVFPHGMRDMQMGETIGPTEIEQWKKLYYATIRRVLK